MKYLLHLCFTSKKEVCCRVDRDYKILVSRIAQAAIYNDTDILAYAVMSNHVHLVVQTERENRFIRSIKASYTQTFNYLYKREGRLFDKGFFKLNLEGLAHKQDAMTYVLQNPWHHKVAENPLDYPYSSMGLYYKRNHTTPISHPFKNKRLLNRNVNLNAKVEYGTDGEILPESFVQVQIVENLFGSYMAFQYLVHRKNYREWKEKQESENQESAYVTFRSVEPLLSKEQVKRIEENPLSWRRRMTLTDIKVCRIIDETFLKKYGCESYTELTPKDKYEIKSILLSDYQYKITEDQLFRCLGL